MSAEKLANLFRVVLDTNVYFSAFTNRSGKPFRIWQQAVRSRFILLASPPIIREVADVLRSDLGWPESEIVALVKLIAKKAQIVVPRETLAVIPDDSDDDRILECAAAGRADLIVSGDSHLTRLKSFRGIGIIRPADFIRTLVNPK